jgi:hypothetical protein
LTTAAQRIDDRTTLAQKIRAASYHRHEDEHRIGYGKVSARPGNGTRYVKVHAPAGVNAA